MSNLRSQAAKTLGIVIQDRVALRESPTVISAPPSEVADYPRVAIWLERFTPVIHGEEELEVDESNEILMGARARLGPGVGPARVDDRRRLSKIGSIRGGGRIFVGCRLAPLREKVEGQISELFYEDTSALSRLLLTLKRPVIGDVAIPWDWTAALFVKDSSWTMEFAFSERVWSWTNFDIEVDVLVARSSPLITRLLVGLEVNYTGEPENPIYFDTDQDGNVLVPPPVDP